MGTPPRRPNNHGPVTTEAHASAPPSGGLRALDDPPGGVLLWIVVALELTTFAMVLGAIAYLRGSETAMFREGVAAMHPTAGLALTLSLVTSGALAAEGVHAFRGAALTRARRCFGGAAAVGMVFLALKLLDYREKLSAGHTVGASDFWNAYYFGTGLHFVHVVVGVVMLALVGRKIGRGDFDDAETAVAGTALFWHMCDLVWFFLFPLFFARF